MGQANSGLQDRRIFSHIYQQNLSTLVAEIAHASEIARTFVDSQGRTLRFELKDKDNGAFDFDSPSGSLIFHLPLHIICKKLDKHGKIVGERELSLVQFYQIYFRMNDLFTSSENQQQLNVSLLDAFDQSSDKDGDECIICMSGKINVSLPCSHAFCESCINAWELSSDQCPVCRRSTAVPEDSWVIADTPTASEMANDVHQLVERIRQ